MADNQLMTQNNTIIPSTNDQFELLVDATLKTVTISSQRIYRRTFQSWAAWAKQKAIEPLELTFVNVAEFLESLEVSKVTRQRELSALRKLAEMLSILDHTNPARDAAYKSLLKLKVSNMPGAGLERERVALSPAQTDKVLRIWNGNSKVHLRNRALIAVLFFSGLRRSEAAALKWSDIDFDNGVIFVRHGKGDVERDVAIAGDYAIEALKTWRKDLGENRLYVFPSLSKGDKLGADEATDAQTVYRVVKATEKIAGVNFSPHTARRTFITEALTNGAPLADVQAQAGHRQESTTLRYARPVNAKHRRERLRLRYG